MTKGIKPNKTFIIRHKETKENWAASSGKQSWKQAGHAKTAFAQSDHRYDKDLIPLKMKNQWREWYEYPRFDDQDVYELIELRPESEEKLQEACTLLALCLQETPFLPDNALGKKITKFIKENECEQG